MGVRIHQLPSLIANQIAAGEVIERPASVVKELLENALDAGATAMSIEIGYGGLNQIKVCDNGTGIHAEDLPLAIAAHATSKINTLNDLYAIDSMGFRGEALASIASVARLTISSKPAEQDTAMMLRVEGIKTHLVPCARAMGTTIDVVDLFFNTPVRKRFLKSEKLEFQAIEGVVKRFALSVPHIAITLKHNGKQIFSLSAAHGEAAQLARLTRIFGNAFMKESIFLDVERSGMRLWGWISNINFQRSQNDRQWVYVNQRMVKDKLISHALKQAYEDRLHPGRFPACVLYFTMNHAEIDVNVHPTKHEVRFQQPRLVHDFFVSQLTKALQTAQIPEKVSDYAVESVKKTQEICEPYPSFLLNASRSCKADELSWVILNHHFIITFIEHQPYLVDLFALKKLALQEQFAQLALPLASRPVLVPMRYSLSPKCVRYYTELQSALGRLGMSLELSHDNVVMIRTIPLHMPHLDLHVFWETIAQAEHLQETNLLQFMIQSQSFEPGLLSSEEKMELNYLLLKLYEQEHQKTGLFQPLTSEDCRNLLHA